MASRIPPRHVPTLTEVVQPAAVPGASAAPVSQEQLVERVMQRVDERLELRLREAVGAAVVEHARALAPVLRDEIEAVVRQAVAEAFEAELGRAPRP